MSERELIICPVKPGTLSDFDKEQLTLAGAIVIEMEDPSEFKLIRPATLLSSSALLSAAVDAIYDHYSSDIKVKFGENVCKAIMEAREQS